MKKALQATLQFAMVLLIALAPLWFGYNVASTGSESDWGIWAFGLVFFFVSLPLFLLTSVISRAVFHTKHPTIVAFGILSLLSLGSIILLAL